MANVTPLRGGARIKAPQPVPLEILRALERKVLWLSSWTIHHANHLRAHRDGLKVGGHQASSASVATLMTALYFHVLNPEDRVAVKPHASPIFHAIQYLLGRQDRESLERFRAYGGAQSYPSRTKDRDDVDFSTGSVGLGVAMTSFAALVQDYLRAKRLLPKERRRGRMVAVVGDAELDEGNVFEAMLEGWKKDVRNVWWVIDYNRQSLDATVTDNLFTRIDELFEATGWRVVTAKYGNMLRAAFARPGGEALRRWIDDCPNSLYAALCYKGAQAQGGSWRHHLLQDIGAVPGVRELLDAHDDDSLHRLMTNLAGHDMEAVLDTFASVTDDRPTCFIMYTIKGYGLPFAGHKDNHAGLMNAEQMSEFQTQMGVPKGQEWDRFAGLGMTSGTIESFLESVPFAQEYPRRYTAARLDVPSAFPMPAAERMSTQDAFGRILNDLARGDSELADRIVTASPDVTVSTNLGAWVNRRGVFDTRERADVFRAEKVVSAQHWELTRAGQHIELGIAENNLFLLLAALGLSHSLFGVRLLPVGTLYDPFINRGLDALNYACYQGARFLLVGTPSGITLAPEGGAHQSVGTPLVGMAQDGLAAFEPAFVDELSEIMRWAFDYMQRDGSAKSDIGWGRDVAGGSVYLRLTTRAIGQPRRTMDEATRAGVIAGGYWLRPPVPGAELAVVCTGAVAEDAQAAHTEIAEDVPGAGLLVVTSADRLNAGWHAARRARRGGTAEGLSHVERLLAPLASDAGLVTVIDGHPATLAWLGAVRGHPVEALGVEHFGQAGDIPDLYRHYGIDGESILDAAARRCLDRAGAR